MKACDNAAWTAHYERLDGRIGIDLLIGIYRLVLFGHVDEHVSFYFS